MPSFDSFSFGCRVNQAELTYINKELIKQGFEKTNINPNLYIINSCAVTQKAEREVRQHIYSFHKKNPNTIIYITGCAGTLWKKYQLYDNLPIKIINNSDKLEIPIILSNKYKNRGATTKNFIISDDKYLDSGRLMIKIQDGCHRFCTYCIVPYLRGKPKSFTYKQILEEINNYQKEKIKEVILTAINTEAYGIDIDSSLVGLIENILEGTNINRLSFGSIHPWSINKDLISLYSKVEYRNRLVRFFHIPIQSGSETVLKLMRRDYQLKDINSLLNQLKKIDKLTFFATDIIVGFLGETEKEFKETYNFLEESPFIKFHVFPYSPRPHTASWFMSKNFFVPKDKIKRERAKILRDLSEKKYNSFCQKIINKNLEGLILKNKINGNKIAILNNNISVIINTKESSNKIVPIHIYDYNNGKLYGKIIKS